jgi:hypothetical protein
VPLGQKHVTLPSCEVRPPVQFEHPPVPSQFLYVPAEHGVHGPPSGPVYPTGHTHPKLYSSRRHASKVHLELPFADDESGGQGRHCTAPGTAENVFSGHGVHGTKMSELLNLPGAHFMHCGIRARLDGNITHTTSTQNFMPVNIFY